MVSAAKMAEPIVEMLLGQTRVGQKSQALGGVHISATWRIGRINLCSGSDAISRYH